LVESTEGGRAMDKIAGYLDISRNTLSRIETIVEAGKQNPELFGDLPRKIDSGHMKINKAWKQVQNHKKRQELIADANKVNLTDVVTDNDSGGVIESRYGEQVIITAKPTTLPLSQQQTDEERIGFLYDTNPIRPYSVWNFQLDTRFGEEYPGRIPAQLVFNTLYFFTKPGDLVVDPMAGGGVVGDVCKQFNRKCSMYDINPIRPDIQKWDVVRQGFPRVEAADLIFWDPLYYKKKEKEYGPESISALAENEYLNVFRIASKQLQCKRLALLMSDYDDYDDSNQSIFIWDYVEIFKNEGWKPLYHIHCPLSTEQIHGDAITKFREERKLWGLSRSLVIFERGRELK
jgi:DNA methylase